MGHWKALLKRFKNAQAMENHREVIVQVDVFHELKRLACRKRNRDQDRFWRDLSNQLEVPVKRTADQSEAVVIDCAIELLAALLNLRQLTARNVAACLAAGEI